MELTEKHLATGSLQLATADADTAYLDLALGTDRLSKDRSATGRASEREKIKAEHFIGILLFVLISSFILNRPSDSGPNWASGFE